MACRPASVFNQKSNISHCRKEALRIRTTGLQDKMDAYLAADRLTTEEYNELVALMAA